MCGGKLGEIADDAGDTAASFDPTTKEGQLNILTGGTYSTVDPLLQDLDDAISGQDQKDAAKAAAAAQEDAALQSLALNTRIYDEGQEKLDPFYQGGLGSLDDWLKLNSSEGAAEFKANYLDGDEFQSYIKQGTDQLASNAAFSGALGSGGTLKNVADYVTDSSYNLSNQALQDELNRLGSNVGISQAAAGSQVSAGQNYSALAGQNYSNIGDAQATAALAGANSGIAPYLQLAETGANIYGATV